MVTKDSHIFQNSQHVYNFGNCFALESPAWALTEVLCIDEAFSRRNSEENQSPPLLSYYSALRGLLSLKVHHLVLRSPSVWKPRPEIKVLWPLTKITKESTRRAEQIPGNIFYPLCGLSRRIIPKLEAWNGIVKSWLLGNMLLVAIEIHLRLWGEGPGMFSDILPSSFNDSNSGQQVRNTWAAC